MQKFELTILGSSAALPAFGRHLSAQVLEIDNEIYLIDCGEGTQLQMLKYGIKKQKIEHIFISHLHGDHIFGLIGLIMTLGLNNRTQPLHIYSPEATLQQIIELQWGHEAGFEVHFHVTDSTQHQLIFESKKVAVYTIPLDHRLPCNGYLFVEKQALPNIIADKIKEYDIPYQQIAAIKAGNDFVLPSGKVIPQEELVRPPAPTRKFAYCSDTQYLESIIPYIEGVDLLYHEATFLHDMLVQAQKTKHTTALQAGQIAQQSNAKKMIIGHFSARYTDLEPHQKEAQTVFLNTHLAEEGISVAIE